MNRVTKECAPRIVWASGLGRIVHGYPEGQRAGEIKAGLRARHRAAVGAAPLLVQGSGGTAKHEAQKEGDGARTVQLHGPSPYANPAAKSPKHRHSRQTTADSNAALPLGIGHRP